jgi:hypothetical protein
MGAAKAARKAAMAAKAAKRAGTQVVTPKAPPPIKVVGKQAKLNQANRARNQATRATSRNAAQQRAIDITAAKQRVRDAGQATTTKAGRTTNRIPKGTRRAINSNPKAYMPKAPVAVTPPSKTPSLFAGKGKMAAAAVVAAGVGYGTMRNRTGRAVDKQTGLPRGMYNY